MNLVDPTLDQDIATGPAVPVTQEGAGGFLEGLGSAMSTAASNIGIGAERTVQQTGRATAAAYMGQLVSDDPRVHDAYEKVLNTVTNEKTLPQYKAYDPMTQSEGARALGGIAESLPALGAAIVNPGLGAAAFGLQGLDKAHSDAAAMGMTPEQQAKYSLITGTASAALGLVPGAADFIPFAKIGATPLAEMGLKMMAGGMSNEALMKGAGLVQAEVLDANGFHEQAEQMRHQSWTEVVTQFVMGMAGPALHHLVASAYEHSNTSPVREPASAGTPETPHAVNPEELNPIRNAINDSVQDAATAETVRHHHDYTSAPGAPVDPVSVRVHSEMMHETMDAMREGRPADYSHLKGQEATFVMGDYAMHQQHENWAAHEEARAAMTGIHESAANAEVPHAEPFTPTSPPSDNGFNHEAIAQGKYDAFAMQHPELAALVHDEYHAMAAQHAQEFADAEIDAGKYAVAAACAISYGA